MRRLPSRFAGARIAVAVLATAGALVAPPQPLAARDDFLHPSSSDLDARERQALDARIADLGNPDPNVRKRAIDVMVAIGPPARMKLHEALQEKDPKLLRNVCLALGALGDPTSLALLEHWFLGANPGEDATRTTLLALARARSPATLELAERLRKLAVDGSLPTVREAALICAGVRKLGGLPDLLKVPLQRERSARVRGCILVALAESGDPAAAPLIAGFLDGRKVRDEKLRRAALHGAARLADVADAALREPLLKFEPDQHEIAAYAVALGAFAHPAVVDRLGDLLVRGRERAALAVHSLAHQPSPEAKEWLTRALAGEFSARVQAEAALAVADLTDQQRFLPKLRELATARPGEPAKGPALLALARIGDAEAAATIAEALPLWRERDLLERGLLLCGSTLGDRSVEQLLPRERATTVVPLWLEIAGIQADRRDPRLLKERIAAALTASRAHWQLARDDLRMAVVRELLELDKVVFVEPRNGENPPDGGSPPPPPPPSEGGGEGGGEGSGPPPGGGDGGPDGALPRRGKQDTARVELDLLRWLADYPPFDLADPFAP